MVSLGSFRLDPRFRRKLQSRVLCTSCPSGSSSSLHVRLKIAPLPACAFLKQCYPRLKGWPAKGVDPGSVVESNACADGRSSAERSFDAMQTSFLIASFMNNEVADHRQRYPRTRGHVMALCAVWPWQIARALRSIRASSPGKLCSERALFYSVLPVNRSIQSASEAPPQRSFRYFIRTQDDSIALFNKVASGCANLQPTGAAR